MESASKAFGSTIAVDDVSPEARDGEVASAPRLLGSVRCIPRTAAGGAAGPTASVPLGACCVELTEPMERGTVVHLRPGPSRLAAQVPGTREAEPGAVGAFALDARVRSRSRS